MINPTLEAISATPAFQPGASVVLSKPIRTTSKSEFESAWPSDVWQDIKDRPKLTVSEGYLPRHLQEAINTLRGVVAELQIDDEQNRPSDRVIGKAQRLLWLLPNDVQLPAISVEPDGAIAFDWIFSRHRMFSMSVSDSEWLVYAWLNDSGRGHGVALSNDRVLPEPIPTLLRMLTRNELASIGTA